MAGTTFPPWAAIAPNNTIGALMKYFIAFVLLVLSITSFADTQCSLQISSPASSLYTFGTVKIDEISGTYIWFAAEVGNITPADPQEISSTSFNYNTLYRVTDSAGSAWYFRFSGEWFDSASTQRTAFYAVQWSGGQYPVLPGYYKIESVSAPRPQAGPLRFSTIGDSMTWFQNAQSFRCLIASYLPGYAFIGSRTDSFGYGHDGHGGDSSGQVIARLSLVPVSDVYFLLIGANDGGYTPADTANNIGVIVSSLLQKNQNAKVYISTLPPRNDQYTDVTLQRNDAIRAWYAAYTGGGNVTLIDLSSAITSVPSAIQRYISSDEIHPNPDGYDLISKVLALAVKSQSATSN